MGKIFVTIFLLVNIFLGYFAEAYQSENSNCSSMSFQQINPSSENAFDIDDQRVEHSEIDCLASHCHFGHCSALRQATFASLSVLKLSIIALDRSLFPSDFVIDLLRPPIFAA